jgi:hypothetical protein
MEYSHAGHGKRKRFAEQKKKLLAGVQHLINLNVRADFHVGASKSLLD